MISPAELRALASRPENIGAMEALLEAAAWIEGTDRLARAVLLFHRGSPWTQEDRALWKELTGSDEATTVTLCDLARSVLVEAPELPPVHDGSEAAKRGDAVRVLKAAIVDAAQAALVTLPWESVAHVIEETGFQLDEHISR